MNDVTFKIVERQNGEFVLFLHNHSRKRVFETLRSRDLDEVVDRLRKEMKYRRHFQNAISNYLPVIDAIEDLSGQHPDWKAETFPKNWTDPLELYGCFREALGDSEKERGALENLLRNKAPEYVWENRLRLVGQRLYLRNCFGDV